MKLKKIPRYLLLLLLTAGASLILGFLSFGGMFALWPVIPLAIAAFVLSVAYEGEIYFQNIKDAFNKLFKSHYLQRELANQFLLNHFPDTSLKTCPEFFKDYEKQLILLHTFDHKTLSGVNKKRHQKIEKTLKDMEKWFALQLFKIKKHNFYKPLSNNKSHDYKSSLQTWLTENNQAEACQRLNTQQSRYRWAKAFSLIAGGFMILSTSYLLVDACLSLPFITIIPFTFWPLFIVPMAIIAGMGYGLLTFNAITDMINNDTLVRWYHTLKSDFKQGITVRNIIITGLAIGLTLLGVALTMCTAGTWWTIAKNARPVFEVMKKIPPLITGIINPMVLGLSALPFNIENTSNTLTMLYEGLKSKLPSIRLIWLDIKQRVNALIATENGFQRINPFRLFLKATFLPLKLLLFFGHLISIGVTGDRVPGIPQWISAALGIISEGFEDYDYFFSHAEGHNHEAPLIKPQMTGNKINKVMSTLPAADTEKDRELDMLLATITTTLPLENTHDTHFGSCACSKPSEVKIVASTSKVADNISSQESNNAERQDNLPLKAYQAHMNTLRLEHLNKQQHHDHHQDLPTRMLTLLFSPLFLAATLWDYGFSQINRFNHKASTIKKTLSFHDAWQKQQGIPPISQVSVAYNELPSSDWERTQMLLHLKQFKPKPSETTRINPLSKKDKSISLATLRIHIKQADNPLRWLNTPARFKNPKEAKIAAELAQKVMPLDRCEMRI